MRGSSIAETLAHRLLAGRETFDEVGTCFQGEGPLPSAGHLLYPAAATNSFANSILGRMENRAREQR